MSRRNSLEAKKARRTRKLLRAPLPAYIDLIEYIKMRVNVTTTVAERIILAGVLRVDSHKIGVEHTPQGKRLRRFVPADLRDRIVVVPPETT